MKNINCPECGLAYLPSAKSCVRCQIPLIADSNADANAPTPANASPAPYAANVAPRPRISRPLIDDTPERTFRFSPIFAVVIAVLLIAVVAYQFTGSSSDAKSAAKAKEKELIAKITDMPGIEYTADNSKSLSKGDPEAQDAEYWEVGEPDFDKILKNEQGVWGASLSSGVEKMEEALKNVAPQRTAGYDPDKVRSQIVRNAPPVCPGRVEDIELIDYKFSEDGDETLLHIKVEGDTYKGNSDSELKVCDDATHIGTATRFSVYVWKVGDRRWVPRVKIAKS